MTVAQLWKKNGRWFVRDLREENAVTAFGSAIIQQMVDHDVTFDQFLKTVFPLSCDELINPNSHYAEVPIIPSVVSHK
jgi:hypothetical protein